MSRILNAVIYYLTAPIRLFGRSRGFRLALGAILIVAICFAVTLWALNTFLTPANTARQAVAKLPPLPPLPPATRPTQVIAPVAISLAAIGRSLDAAAPREIVGKNDNPVSNLLSKADVGITVSRGTITVAGRPNELAAVVPINGNLKLSGQIAGQAGGAIGNLLGGALGQDIAKLTTRALDQNAELRGQVVVYSKPALGANWRLTPNLSGQLNLSDTAISIAGVRLNVANEARPLIDRAMNEQIAVLESRLRNDPFIERAAREQWAKLCRSIPLGGDGTGLPPLWLEMKPVRAAAAQPQVDARNLTLTVGIHAETRIVPTATKPACPFPEKLELVPPMESGKIAVGVPIDVPFTELNKLLEAQLKGHRYPDDKNAPVEVEVRSASLAAAGDRLLISLRVKAHEKKSWFDFGAEANIAIWGKPTLDQKTQVLRLTDVSLAVESEAAYGLLGAAARAAMPYLQQALSDNAVIDLKPFAADALKKIEGALADFTKDSAGVKVDASVSDLRLTGIEFDAKTLRVIAEANGRAKVEVTELPKL